jgi:hypothetical protein
VTGGVLHDVDVDGWKLASEPQLRVVESMGVRLYEQDLNEFALRRADGVEVVGEPVNLRDSNVDSEPADHYPGWAVRKAPEGGNERTHASAGVASEDHSLTRHE